MCSSQNVHSFPTRISWSFGLPKASVFRDLRDLLIMSFNNAIYPVLDFAGYAIAVA